MSKLNAVVEAIFTALSRVRDSLPSIAQYEGYVGSYGEFYRHEYSRSRTGQATTRPC
jgi:hypothetical protein